MRGLSQLRMLEFSDSVRIRIYIETKGIVFMKRVRQMLGLFSLLLLMFVSQTSSSHVLVSCGWYAYWVCDWSYGCRLE